MFLENLKIFIKNNPQIVMVTNRGLETADRKVVFIAKDLDKRYPELKKLFKQDIISEHIKENISPKCKKSKKK